MGYVPLVVVLMSVYKKDLAPFLAQAIKSILNQSYNNYKLYILIDGPVGKEISSVIHGFAELRIEVFSSPTNRGLAASLNNLIEIALRKEDVDYFARMDADDISEIARLQRQVEFLESNREVDILGTACTEINEYGESLYLKAPPATDKELKNNIIKRCPFVHPSVMMRAEVFRKGIRYPEESHLSEDMYLWYEMAKRGFKFGNLKEPLIKYRLLDSTLKRRTSFRKGLSEFKGKWYAMSSLKMLKVENVFYSVGILILRSLPIFLVKRIYRKMR